MFEIMKFIECPYCQKKAVGPFGLLIFLTPLSFFKDCRYCQNDIKLNYKFLFTTIAIPILGLYILSYWIGSYVVLFVIVYLIALTALMKTHDPKLFKRNDAWSNITK